ncbi:MAG TPA: anti-sigma factor [Acidimicrobiales bacterium]|nr:anti-sigma factor [Acidimicrobiales bacterium]
MTICEDNQAGYLAGEPDALAHVVACPTCGHLLDELDLVREMLANKASFEAPRADLEDRVVATVIGASGVAPVVSLEAARKRRGDMRRVPIWALAAAVAIAVAATATVTNRSQPGPKTDGRFAMSGTELASGASARATFAELPNGLEIRLRITGLRRAPKGSFYQAWVKGDAGLVPIGTFHTGDGAVVLWSGVDSRKYHTVTVTIEEEDNNPASSGRRVLSGEIPPQ